MPCMQIAKIRLRKPTRVFAFRCPEDLALDRGENCVVRSERGLELGSCVLPPEAASEEEWERTEVEVVRKASVSDEADFLELETLEKKAMATCAEKIAVRQLPMKLVDAEYTLDKNKIVFYFTAAERVDFRQLVRDLAQAFKTRIELRHIQVRDAARLVGGLGVCGRELCCCTWLGEFQPISMKMAKRQNLSLNPTKISGQCGRLLCCLSYENMQYSKGRLKDAPPPEEAVPPENQTGSGAEGEGPVSEHQDDAPRDQRHQETPSQGGAAATGQSQDDPPRRRKRRRRKKTQGDGASGGGQGSSGGDS